MKKTAHYLINLLPIFLWILYFLFYYYDVKLNVPAFVLQIALLLFIPIVFSIYNSLFCKNKKNFLMLNSILGISQIVGYCLTGFLHYNLISDDSKTIIVTQSLSGISVVYILFITFVFFGVRFLIDKKQNK